MSRSLLAFFTLLVIGSFGSQLIAEDEFIPRRQSKPPGPPLSPEDAVKKMTVPEGFTVEVVASEPQILNPVAMTFDEKGRIWVTESFEYPRRSPGPGRDRVKVLEDTDGDGKVDKVTVFAEGLNIPSGIAVGHGGVWVANAPDILFLQDTDGDGKADKKQVVVTGFGRTDTHELPNSLTWGPDGWLYGLNGVFNYSRVKHRGKEYAFTCAMFRIHPKTWDFELFAEGTSNPWGIAWDHEGSAFISACVIDHLWHITESGYYHRQGGPYPPFTWKLGSIVKHKHQLAAYCGIHYFDSDAYPKQYRDKLYMGNIHGGCINVDEVERKGSTYFGKPKPDFLTANDVWFMPVVQKTGPDGCLYVLDWYDRYHCYQDANHDPEGIDRLKGRLYRIRYNGTPRKTGFDLAKASNDELIEQLKNPNVYFRDIAQRILTERGGDKKLLPMVLDQSIERKYRMHALWALISSTPSEKTMISLMDSSEPEVRAWGVRALGNTIAANTKQTATQLSRSLQQRWDAVVTDSSADVRLQAAIATTKILDGQHAVQTLLTILKQDQNDDLIPHIVWQNLHPLLEQNSLAAVDYIRDEKLNKVASVRAILPRMVDRILGRNTNDPEPVAAILGLLIDGESPDLKTASQCLQYLSERVQNRELKGDDLKKTQAALSVSITPILKNTKHPLYADGLILAASMGDTKSLKLARDAFVSSKADARLRARSLEAMVIAGADSVIDDSSNVLKSDAPTSLKKNVLTTLAKMNDKQVGSVIVASLGQLPEGLKATAADVLTQRSLWSASLLDAVESEQIPKTTLNVTQLRRLMATGEAKLKKRVEKIWGKIRETRSPEREFIVARMKRLIRETPGNPHKGKAVFKKVCAQCHKIYGEGYDVGPDITRNGRNNFNQLLSNVFDPNLVIGPAYQARTVVTSDGRVINGLVTEENNKRVVIKMQGGKMATIPRGEIEIMKVSEVSLMPEQLEKQLKQEELVDLFAFLVLDKPPTDKTAKQLSGATGFAKTETSNPAEFSQLVSEIAPGFTCNASGEGGVALLPKHEGKANVLRTHPVSEKVPTVLKGAFELPENLPARLELTVGHQRRGDWDLRVVINGKKVKEARVGHKNIAENWMDVTVDLSDYSGQKINVELHNAANNWAWEFGYWYKVDLVIDRPSSDQVTKASNEKD